MKRAGPLKRYQPKNIHTFPRSKDFISGRTKLRAVGISDVATVKRSIQKLLREIVMIRDGGCILRNVRNCGGELDTPGVVIQADHLISRSHAATFAYSRLVVCVCRSCHAWKSLGGNLRKAQYDALVRTILPPDRVKLWDACEADSYRPVRTGVYDWKMAETVLTAELRGMMNTI